MKTPPQLDLDTTAKSLASWTPRRPSAAIRDRLFKTSTVPSAQCTTGFGALATLGFPATWASWLMPWGAAGAAAVMLLAWLVVPGLPSLAIAAGTNSSQIGPAEWAGNYLAGVNSVPIQRLTSTLSNVAPSTKLQLRGWN